MFKYDDNENNFNVKDSSFLCIMGNTKEVIFNNIINGNNCEINNVVLNKINYNNYYNLLRFVSFKDINTFSAETVGDILAFGLENKAYKRKDMLSKIKVFSKDFKIDDLLDKDPASLSMSKKVVMKIVQSLIVNPKLFLIDDSFDLLNEDDKTTVVNELNKYINAGNCVILFTSNIENDLLCDNALIYQDNKIILHDSVNEVLKEEKILKRLGISMPNITQVCSYLKSYEILDKYYSNTSLLVRQLWK